VNKTTTTLNIPAPARPEIPREAQWKEARAVFPIYLALAKQLQIEIPFSQAKRNLPEKPDIELFTQVQEWLDSMDQKVLVHQPIWRPRQSRGLWVGRRLKAAALTTTSFDPSARLRPLGS
jgi:hypothetical protein